MSVFGRWIRATFALLALHAVLGTAQAQPGPNLPVYTSPIDVTGGRFVVSAFAPDRNSGAMVQYPLPPGILPSTLSALTSTPINFVMDARWNGTAAERAAGISPRQQACDGPSGVRARIVAQVAAKDERAYDISCNFSTTGRVYVKQTALGFYLSYQILSNSVSFRTTSSYTCNPDHGTIFCPNDPRFELKFAVELLTLVWTPSLCGVHADAPSVFLHGVQFDSRNASGAIGILVDALFGGNKFMAGELAMQAQETRGPMSLDPAFAELRSSASCTGTSPTSRLFATFSELDVLVGPNIELRATHPPIVPPLILNTSLPYGADTCKAGYVWREAFSGDHVCVTPSRRAQAAADNAQAAARRSGSGGPFGAATCRQGYVWREARVGDVVCVTPATRQQTRGDNDAAASRRVLQPALIPSFTRPSLNAPPIVRAGDGFTVSGQFYPGAVDPTTLVILMDRVANSACYGGATELEMGVVGQAMAVSRLPVSAGGMSSCNYKYVITPLLTATRYRFRSRDCDAVTCSLWSGPYETLTGTAGAGPGPVVITLDTGAVLGSAVTDTAGAFQQNVTMPAGTPPGPHKLSAASGAASDVADIQVTGRAASAQLVRTGAFYGDKGCPMRPAPTNIPAGDPFSLFGSGFQPGLVGLNLDSSSGLALGTIQAQLDGSFCGYFTGPPPSFKGSHTLVATQSGAVRATLPVEIIIVDPLH